MSDGSPCTCTTGPNAGKTGYLSTPSGYSQNCYYNGVCCSCGKTTSSYTYSEGSILAFPQGNFPLNSIIINCIDGELNTNALKNCEYVNPSIIKLFNFLKQTDYTPYIFDDIRYNFTSFLLFNLSFCK